MANIRVDVPKTIFDGFEVVFHAPCDCSQIAGLNVYYPDSNGETTFKSFVFKDAHGNDLSDMDNLFTANVYVKVILNVTDGEAYIQNADTNKYIEDNFQKKFIHLVPIDKPENYKVISTSQSNIGVTTSLYVDGKFFLMESVGKSRYSEDGINWHNMDFGEASSTRLLRQVAYGNGIFVASYYTAYCYYSYDGITWMQTSFGYDGSSKQLGNILFVNGKFYAFCILLNKVFISEDGINWTQEDLVSDCDSVGYSVMYGNGKFVAFGSSKTIHYSEDGINWTQSFIIEDTDISYPATSIPLFMGSKFLFYYNTSKGLKNKVIHSEDGVTWSIDEINVEISLNKVMYIDDHAMFIACGVQGLLLYSYDGITFEQMDTGLDTSSATTMNTRTAVYGQNKLIVSFDYMDLCYPFEKEYTLTEYLKILDNKISSLLVTN